ncbi:MAG: homocysteine S-methyltransferase family protein [Aquiluna sp.]|nr:homocysteine S-methyltransferase family protein [Aquiluna sp.]
MTTISFRERLEAKQPVILAGGYLFEVERRGYLKAGEFVPKVALDHPEVLEQVTTDFVRAGSDVAIAFTYNGHREKMRIIGQEHLLEPLNRSALRIARRVADEQTSLLGRQVFMAGNISNSNIFDPAQPETADTVRLMYREMISWAKQEGADLILAETMYFLAEAEIALEEIQAAGLASIVNVAVFDSGLLMDGLSPADACVALSELGADVVGTNCFQGPNTIRPIFESIASSASGHTCAMPSAYRTTEQHTTLFNLPDEGNTAVLPTSRTFPDALESQVSNRFEVAEFAAFAVSAGAKVVGLCCGAGVIHHRAVAEELGSSSYLTKYSTDMSKHFLYGSDGSLSENTKKFGEKA